MEQDNYGHFDYDKDEQWVLNELKEIERIIKMHNNDPYIERKEVRCEKGEHYILINEFGMPQCSHCLTLFDWEAVRNELKRSGLPGFLVRKRYKELRRVSRRVMNGRPPRNIVNWNDYRYLTGKGYQYIERWFYERD